MNFCELQAQGVNLALTTLRGAASVAAMPFIDDDMFSSWSPTDGRMSADFTSCIQVQVRFNLSMVFMEQFLILWIILGTS